MADGLARPASSSIAELYAPTISILSYGVPQSDPGVQTCVVAELVLGVSGS